MHKKINKNINRSVFQNKFFLKKGNNGKNLEQSEGGCLEMVYKGEWGLQGFV